MQVAAAGLLALLLFGVGMIILLGPDLRRSMARLRGLLPSPARTEPEPEPRQVALSQDDLHPTSWKVAVLGSQLAAILRRHGEDERAERLLAAVRALKYDEPNGLRGIDLLLDGLAQAEFGAVSDREKVSRMARAMRHLIADRSEQLELLPWR